MARARNLKPAFFDNEELGSAEPLWSLLFAGLWTIADRAGRLEDRPTRIKGQVFPYRPGADVSGGLDWLTAHGFIERYTVDGARYIQIVKFALHQRPHWREPEVCPPPPRLEGGPETTILHRHDVTVRMAEGSGGNPTLSLAEPELGRAGPELGRARPGLLPLTSYLTPTTSTPPSAGGGGGGEWMFPKEFLLAWNEAAAANGWTPCARMTPRRVEALKARVADHDWREQWMRALVKAAPIPGLRGAGATRFIANIDWFLKDGVVQDLVVGRYDTWLGKGQPPADPAIERRRREQAERTRDCETCSGSGGVSVPHRTQVVDGVWLSSDAHLTTVPCPCTGSKALDEYTRHVPNWRELMRDRQRAAPVRE